MRSSILLSVVWLTNLSAMEIEESMLAAFRTQNTQPPASLNLIDSEPTSANLNSSDSWKSLSLVIDSNNEGKIIACKDRPSFSAHLVYFNESLPEKECSDILSQAAQKAEGKVALLFFPEFHCALVKRFWSAFEPQSSLFLRLLAGHSALKVVQSLYGCIPTTESSHLQKAPALDDTYWHASSMIVDDIKAFVLNENDEMVSIERPSSSTHIVRFSQFSSEVDCTKIVRQAAELAGGKVEFKLFPEFNCALVKRFWAEVESEHTDRVFLPYLSAHKDVFSIANFKRQ